MENVKTNILIDHREEICADMLIQTPLQAFNVHIGNLRYELSRAYRAWKDDKNDLTQLAYANADLAYGHALDALDYYKGERNYTIFAWLGCHSEFDRLNNILKEFGLIPPCKTIEEFKEQYHSGLFFTPLVTRNMH